MARPESSARDKARRPPSASTKAETVEEVSGSSSSAAPADGEEVDAEEPGRLAPLEAELAATFEEWDRRYREDPSAFVDLLEEEPASYGEHAARWFVRLFDEVVVDVDVTVDVSDVPLAG
jgi:hypothetical protein